MASCSYCGREVSPNAKTCPGCGEEDPGSGSVLAGILIFGFVGLAIVGAIISAIVDWVTEYKREVILFLITCGVIGVGYVLWKKKKSDIPGPKQTAIPDLGPNYFDATEILTISEWFIKVGDHVEEGDLLLTVETDKASVELLALSRGVIDVIYYPAGSQVSVGDIVCEFR